MSMFSCLGLSFLGQCEYNPSDPANLYFSIGEAVAALSITLVIPQFLKPIFIFRLKTQAIRLYHIYIFVFIATFFCIIAALIPNIEMDHVLPFHYPIFWELLAGLLFFVAFGALALPFLRPSALSNRRCISYTIGAADFLAHANDRDRTDFSKDLLRNVEALMRLSAFGEYRREQSAFFLFTYRREIQSATYASALLQLISEPQFCAVLVQKCPWDTAEILKTISRKQLDAGTIRAFVRELGRQAIISPVSMMGREIEYRGFRSAPLLTSALFEDRFINRTYQPLRGLSYGDRLGWDLEALKRLNHAALSALKLALAAGDYWSDQSLSSLDDYYSWAIRDAHAQIRKDQEKYAPLVEIGSGLRDLIRQMNEHLATADPTDRAELYADLENDRPFTILDYLAELVVESLFAFANDFDGWDDPFWHMAREIVDGVFPWNGTPPDGMNPFQQRVAIKLLKKTSENMDGWYPALSRILLAVLGPFESKDETNNSAHGLLKRAFYYELVKYPDLYQKDVARALDKLPATVRYSPTTATFIHRYRMNNVQLTELKRLSLKPISFAKEVVSAN